MVLICWCMQAYLIMVKVKQFWRTIICCRNNFNYSGKHCRGFLWKSKTAITVNLYYMITCRLNLLKCMFTEYDCSNKQNLFQNGMSEEISSDSQCKEFKKINSLKLKPWTDIHQLTSSHILRAGVSILTIIMTIDGFSSICLHIPAWFKKLVTVLERAVMTLTVTNILIIISQ